MTGIRLHNTKTRRKEDFTPIDPQNVRMYVCGPTVYDRAHLGNARPVVVFDVLYRLLRHVYGAEAVTYVRNFTDVDDKINASALARQQAGDPRSLEALIRERTEETIGWYHADMDALGALRPDQEPRATEFIPQMVAMIEALIASGHAYAREGHTLFRVRSYKDYGKLSGRSVDDMIAGARVEVAPFKEDPMDFVLWKPSSDQEPGWDSPWGRGRPGWHIECSAMAYELLGANFDIHAGGIDLQFPHHENEIAQSCCAHPEAGFANVWLHNEMLQVEGKKMSKSLGNFFTVRDLLEAPETAGRNEPLSRMNGREIRMAFMMTHYRKPMDLTAGRAQEVRATLDRWHQYSGGLFGNRLEGIGSNLKLVPGVVDALADDLNTFDAIRAMHIFEKMYLRADTKELARVAQFGATIRFLGLDDGNSDQANFSPNVSVTFERGRVREKFGKLIHDARQAKDFDTADRLRQIAMTARFDVKSQKERTYLDENLNSDYDMLRAELK